MNNSAIKKLSALGLAVVLCACQPAKKKQEIPDWNPVQKQNLPCEEGFDPLKIDDSSLVLLSKDLQDLPKGSYELVNVELWMTMFLTNGSQSKYYQSVTDTSKRSCATGFNDIKNFSFIFPSFSSYNFTDSSSMLSTEERSYQANKYTVSYNALERDVLPFSVKTEDLIKVDGYPKYVDNKVYTAARIYLDGKNIIVRMQKEETDSVNNRPINKVISLTLREITLAAAADDLATATDENTQGTDASDTGAEN